MSHLREGCETHTGLHSRVSGNDRLGALLEIVVPAREHIVPHAGEANAGRQPWGPFQPLDVIEVGERLKVEVTPGPLQGHPPLGGIRRRRGKALRMGGL